MIEGARLPHQVRAQGGAVIAHTGLSLELHLASPIQLLHGRTSWRGAITNTKRIERSRSKSRSHVSHDQETLKLQQEVEA